MNKIGQTISGWFNLNKTPFVNLGDNPNAKEKLAFMDSQKLGQNSKITVPDFNSRGNGTERPLLHLDYTASAQGLKFVEDYLQKTMNFYANTHTETSETGRVSTTIFHKSIDIIREHVNAGDDSFVIPVGYGATGAIERMQKILGVYLSPKTRKQLIGTPELKDADGNPLKYVVFVGPYEHHSNDVSWQDNTLCEFVRIKSLKTEENFTEIDYQDLEEKLESYKNYNKIGCFSAASNVTGIKTDISRLGKTLKKHGAMYFLDYAAAGPYVQIDMTKNCVDAIFLSAHKNIGGTNLGLLVAKNCTYDKTVSPTFGGGGTVQAVTPWSYHFHEDIEEREYSGTPAIRQTWQAALSFQIKEWIGYGALHEAESTLITKFMDLFKNNYNLEVLGNKNPDKRVGIFSFLIKHGDRVIHHNLVASLLNDLFGIQARSGCACAGPFGHELLSIDKSISDKFVKLILNVKNGFKPGWTRIGSHYTLSNDDVDYIFKALRGISIFAPLFINDYRFCPNSGEWKVDFFNKPKISFGIEDLFEQINEGGEDTINRKEMYHTSTTDFVNLIASKIIGLVDNQISGQVNISTLEQKITKIIESESSDTEDVMAEILNGYPSNIQSALHNALDAYLSPNTNDSSPFSSMEQMDPHVRFFYAPRDFDSISQSEFLGEGDQKICTNK